MATRDLPKSVGDLTFGWYEKSKKEIRLDKLKKTSTQDGDLKRGSDSNIEAIASKASMGPIVLPADQEIDPDVGYAKKLWPIFTTGAGLFSDGYVNNSISTVSTCLGILYGDEYTESRAISNVSAIAFAGTVCGQLLFGVLADYQSRKSSMLIATVILIIFTILCSGAWGYKGSHGGLFAAITAYRFFIGIGIGAEYSAGSTAASECSMLLPAKRRNRYFVWFTNFMIDFGFVVSAVVPFILLEICRQDHLTPVWRITLGLGAIPPISLFFMRLKYKESEQFSKMSFKKVRVPYWSVIKFYWFRLIVVSLIWFIYDFSSYSFSIYSSYIIDKVVPGNSLYKTFGWNIVFNLFYMPGAFLGALSADYFGPRLTLVTGVFLQAIIGFGMAAGYPHLKEHVGGFVVVFGIFTTLGEFGPGDNIGLLASKTSSTPIRGQYYGIAAATGKIGAFVGTYVFPVIIRNAGGSNTDSGNQAPFYVSSALCLFSAFLALFFLPRVDSDAIIEEDHAFLEYLQSTGFDISQLGTKEIDTESADNIVDPSVFGPKVIDEAAKDDATSTSGGGSIEKVDHEAVTTDIVAKS